MEIHKPLGDKLDHVLEQIGTAPFLGEFARCNSRLGYRGFSADGQVSKLNVARYHVDLPPHA